MDSPALELLCIRRVLPCRCTAPNQTEIHDIGDDEEEDCRGVHEKHDWDDEYDEYDDVANADEVHEYDEHDDDYFEAKGCITLGAVAVVLASS